MPAGAGPSIRLRDYQVEALAAIEVAAARGIRRQLLVLPTGTGKTVVFADLIRRRGGRAVVLVHRDELARQADDKIRLVSPDAAIGIVKAERNETLFPIIVASVQTLVRPARLAQLGTVDTIIVDEAHHAAAESYRTILETLGAFADDGPLVVGVTATADRGDGRGLDGVFEEIVFERDILTMIEGGYLCDLTAKQIRLAADFNALHTRAGDFIESEAEQLLLDANAPTHAVRAYQEHAGGRKALIFTPGVESAHLMARAFTTAGIAAGAIDGVTPLEERRETLVRFSTGDVRVLGNCLVLTEGYDEPTVDCIIVARPTKSRSLYTQMIGRGTRPSPGKEDCLILDLVGSTTRHDLLTAASLFGVAPRQLETATVFEAVVAERYRTAAINERTQLVAESVDLFRRRRLHWVHGRGETFILSCGTGHIILRPDAGAWTALFDSKAERVVIAHRLPLEYAQGASEDYARRLGAQLLVNPAAAWRRRPASEKQLVALRRFRVEITPGLTAGEASDLLSAAIADARCSA